jgi:hypothetical protein
MAAEATGPACPISAFGLVFMPTSRTPARCASFGGGRAHDVGSSGFVGEIVDIFPILPAGHTLVVMPAVIPIAYAMRVADEERPDPVPHTEVDDLPGRLMSQMADTTLSAAALLVPGTLQLLPAARILLASSLLPGDFPELLVTLSFERADTTPGDDYGLTCSGGDGAQVDFAQINCRTVVSWSLFRLWHFYAYMQLKAMVPDQRTGATGVWQIQWQDKGFAALAHRQDYPSVFLAHRLGRPGHRIEAFLSPGVLHAQLWMLFAQLMGRVDSSQEGPEDGLNRLAMQGKPSPGDLLHLVLPRPLGMLLACVLVQFATHIPHLGGFHLGRFQPLKERGRKGVESIDLDRLHTLLFFFSAQKRNITQCHGK